MRGAKRHRAPWGCHSPGDEAVMCVPGRTPKSDDDYFEIMCLCLLQAGLRWGTVRRNWGKYRRGFLCFTVDSLAKLGSADNLMGRKDTIKNRPKIGAVIYNAKEFQKILAESGSFQLFLQGSGSNVEYELKKRFKRLGPQTVRYFLHSVGYSSKS